MLSWIQPGCFLCQLQFPSLVAHFLPLPPHPPLFMLLLFLFLHSLPAASTVFCKLGMRLMFHNVMVIGINHQESCVACCLFVPYMLTMYVGGFKTCGREGDPHRDRFIWKASCCFCSSNPQFVTPHHLLLHALCLELWRQQSVPFGSNAHCTLHARACANFLKTWITRNVNLWTLEISWPLTDACGASPLRLWHSGIVHTQILRQDDTSKTHETVMTPVKPSFWLFLAPPDNPCISQGSLRSFSD